MSTLEPLIPGKAWQREARRSARTRLTPAIITPAGPATDVRGRYAASRQTHGRNLTLPERAAAKQEERTRRRRRLASARSQGSSAQDDDYGARSPTPRSQCSGASFNLPRVGTGDFQDDDDDSDSSYNSFNLSLQKKALFGDEVSASADAGLNTDGATDTPSLKPQPSAWKNEDRDRQVTVYRIYRSRYEGVNLLNGNLSAQLMTGTNRKVFQRELSKPLFRWIHFENPSMNFSTFAQTLLELPYLDEQERSCAAGILKVARQRSDQSLRMPAGKKGMYVEPEYYDETIRQTVFQGFRSRREKTQFIRWMCLPYFVVEDRSTVSRQTPESDEDLPPTSHFLNSGYVSDGKHYQVAQLWILMIGNGILFTCARRSVDFLVGTSINIKTLPPADPQRRSVGDRAPIIIVSDGGNRTWLLPVEDCKTWPEFSANFAELDVDLYNGWYLLYQDLRLSRTDWPKVVKIAQKSSIRLTLERRDDNEDDDTMSECSPDDEVKSKSTSATQPEPAKEATKELNDPARHHFKNTWHVFTLLATKISGELTEGEIISLPTTDSAHSVTLDNQILIEDANEIASYLLSVNKRRGEKTAYASCPRSTMSAVQKTVDTLSPAGERPEQATRQVHLLEAVQNIFTFFYPPEFDHEITQKYWGAAKDILAEAEAETPSLFFLQRYRNIRNLSRFVEDIKEELFLRRSPAHHHTNVPHEFIQAWMLLLMHFVLFNTYEAERTSNYVARCRSLLNRGKMKVIQRLQTFTLQDKEAVLPLGATALTIGQLIEDAKGGPLFPERHRLTGLYWDELQLLTAAVHDDALNRRHQERFVFLKSEFETIISTLEDQQRVLVALDDSITESEANSVINEGLSKSASRETGVIECSLQNTEETMANFIDMERRRAELESWRFRIIESAKDRQEKAALTFTTVTVLFLPLTLLASIFGMNTEDIRNMPQKQWLFWVIAAPLCAAGLVIWLAYLGTLQIWWKRAMTSRDKGTKSRAMRKAKVGPFANGKVAKGVLP